ncbi:MAG: hypothetical protein HYV27_10900 [Candidatus Hydrogenedentes bacterium]|nr:hypothetical protein [Candidatus Hydrogenedentota bacterium]
MNARRATDTHRWKAFILVLTLPPPLALLFFYLRFSVDFPYLDQWEFVLFLQRYHETGLSFADFWAQHNEHRLIFPRLIMLGLALLSGWDIRCELAMNYALGCAVFLCLAQYIRVMQIEAITRAPAIIWPTLSLFCFSMSQWQNWFLGWQLQEYLNVLAVLVALYAVTVYPLGARGQIAGILAAIVATYSFGNGIFVWPISMILLGIRTRDREPGARVWLVTWSVAGLGALASYLYGFEVPPHHPGMEASIGSVFAYPGYFFAFVGQPVWNFNVSGAILAGILGTALWFVLVFELLRRDHRALRTRLLLLGLGLYSLGSALITAYARAGYGLEQAMSPRYVTMAQLLWVACLIGIAMRSAAPGQKLLRAASGLILVAGSLSYLYGAYRWTERYHAYAPVRDVLLTGDDETMIRRIYPEPGVVLERREILRNLRYSIFRDEEVSQ